MKRLRFIALALVIAITAIMICSCGSDVAKIIDKKSEFEKNPALSASSEITALKGFTYVSSAANLALFKNAEDKYSVYNITTGTVVASFAAANDNSDIEVELDYVDAKPVDHAYIVVHKTTVVNLETTEETELYAANGTKLATAEGKKTPAEIVDTVILDGKVYRAADGNLAYAFDYNTLGMSPSIQGRNGDYYYGFAGHTAYIYDLSFKLCVKHELPDYANVVSHAALLGGNMLIQYFYDADPYSDDYDYINGEDKYILKTLLIKAKSGDVKEIDCDYLLSTLYNSEHSVEKYGIKDDYAVTGEARLIEDRRLGNTVYVYADEDGKIKELGRINGSSIAQISRLAEDVWAAATIDEAIYLVNEVGDVIGDVSNASLYGGYLAHDGKLYNNDLTVLYDYEAEDFTRVAGAYTYLLFKDEDGNYYRFNGTAAEKLVLPEGAVLNAGSNYYTVYSAENGTNTCKVYNAEGTAILTKSSTSPITVTVAYRGNDGEVIFRVTEGTEVSYYAAK